MNLIEKEYALEKAENQYYLNIIDERTKNEIIKFIKSLPFAESEIIRCKDCEHYRDGHPGTDCCWDFEYNERRQTPDSYCSGAERRTEE